MSDEVRREFDEVIEKLRKELEEVGRRVEGYLERGEVLRAYRVWRDGALDSLKELRESLDRLSNSIKESKMSEEELRKLAEHLRDSIRDVAERIENIGERVRRARGGRGFALWVYSPPFKQIIRGIDLTVDRVLEGVEELVDSIERSLEDVGKRLTQVVSVRIRNDDMEVIDQLVDAGVFKSRSEAVAYFTRRGIEASREWIDKALQQVKKIREIQESLRKEIEQGDEGNDPAASGSEPR